MIGKETAAGGPHYLDNAATTRVLEQAAQAAWNCMRQDYGNPSSQHELGRRAAALLDRARGQVAAALDCPPNRVIFTSCGTESANTAIQNAARRGRRFGRRIVSTQIEHKATLETLKALGQQGWDIVLVPPEKDGTIDPGKIEAALGEDVILLTLAAVNSETGAVLPWRQAAQAARRKAPHCLTHIDGVQAFCKLPLPLEDVDYLSVSAHKIGGCKGAGALYCREPRLLQPLLWGGGQEGGLRSGTEGTPQICAFGEACALRAPNRERDAAHMEGLKQKLLSLLPGLPCPVRVNSPADGAPHILNFSPAAGRSEVLTRVLSDQGVYVSGGSACSRGRRSYVLERMKLPAQAIDSALRVSFCPENDETDVEALIQALGQALRLFV